MYFYVFIYFINKFQTPVWGTLKYLGEGSQAWKVGYRIQKSSCIIERRWGGDASGCAGESVGFDCVCAKLSYPKRGSRQLWCHLMMSLFSCLCWGKGVYKGVCMSLWGSWGEFSGHTIIVEGQFLPFSHKSPLTPTLATSVHFEEWDYHRQESVTYLFPQWHTLRVSLSVFSL